MSEIHNKPTACINITVDFFTDLRYVSLSIEAKYAYFGLILQCKPGDLTLFFFEPKKFKALILPGESVDLKTLIDELEEYGLAQFTNDPEEGPWLGLFDWQNPNPHSIMASLGDW